MNTVLVWVERGQASEIFMNMALEEASMAVFKAQLYGFPAVVYGAN